MVDMLAPEFNRCCLHVAKARFEKNQKQHPAPSLVPFCSVTVRYNDVQLSHMNSDYVVLIQHVKVVFSYNVLQINKSNYKCENH